MSFTVLILVCKLLILPSDCNPLTAEQVYSYPETYNTPMECFQGASEEMKKIEHSEDEYFIIRCPLTRKV